MPDFSTRSTAIEIMDDLNCSGPMVNQTLIEIEFINKWLGGNAVTLSGFREVLKHYPKNTPLKIADLGCGGGEMLKVAATLTGIDANPHIIAFAENHATDFPEITFKTVNILSDEFYHIRYDIVLGTLFFHHFTKEELIATFAKLKNNHRCSVVINDLHRHWLAYYAIKFLTAVFSKSDMVKYDAPLSVHRGFTRTELKEILQAAGVTNFTLRWRWAFRWQVIILP
jgi:2-polyprenyl-3-methyl-5-hydroxy-6-metoxy-1,4-benzoquinol methylase